MVLALALGACGPAGGGGGGFAAEYQVNVTDDSDDGSCSAAHCSLREAINAANAHAGFDLIKFDIGGGGAQTISPTSALPEITDAVAINGTTQPGYSGSPLIELDGTNAPVGANGLTVRVTGCNVRGLGSTASTVPRAGIRLQPTGTARGSRSSRRGEPSSRATISAPT